MSSPDGNAAALLEALDIRKAYGGALALRGASLRVLPGQVHALLGTNGAGKSTLIKCLAGTPPPDSGAIAVAGRRLPDRHTAAAATEAGLAFIHQEGTLIEDLSVEENIALADGYPRHAGVLIDWRGVTRVARAALDEMGVEIDPKTRVAELPPASRTVVDIVRALRKKARLVVLDEPTASLGAKDVAGLFRILRRIAAAGSGIVFVSHRLEEVYDLCDAITVLRDGANVGTVRPQDISRHDLVTMIVGHEVHVARKSAPPRAAMPVLSASALEGGLVGPLDFSVGRGEIVGFTGLSDAGHYELGELTFGLSHPTAGRLDLSGRPFAPASPAAAMAAGVSYVPPDRNRDGLARYMSLTENLFLNPRRPAAPLTAAGLVRARREKPAAERLLRKFAVRPPTPEAQISSLSGGNAQKVLVARWLAAPAPVLVVNDPSAGVDVGAREDLYAAIREAAAGGAAVLVITSDFEEIETLCSRAFVFVRGRPRAELEGDDVSVVAMSNVLAGASGPRTLRANPAPMHAGAGP